MSKIDAAWDYALEVLPIADQLRELNPNWTLYDALIKDFGLSAWGAERVLTLTELQAEGKLLDKPQHQLSLMIGGW